MSEGTSSKGFSVFFFGSLKRVSRLLLCSCVQHHSLRFVLVTCSGEARAAPPADAAKGLDLFHKASPSSYELHSTATIIAYYCSIVDPTHKAYLIFCAGG